jgi:hypothetical protein
VQEITTLKTAKKPNKTQISKSRTTPANAQTVEDLMEQGIRDAQSTNGQGSFSKSLWKTEYLSEKFSNDKETEM